MRKFFIAAALAVVAMFGSTKSASADFKLYLQEDGVNGGAITEVASGADFTSIAFGFPVTATYGDFSVKVLSGSSDNGATLSDLLSSTNSVKNNATAALPGDTGVRTLRIYVSQTNYTLPAGTPLIVESGMGGSVNTGVLANGLLSPNGLFQAFASNTNNLLAMGGFTNGPQVDTQTGSTFDTGSASGSFNRTAGQPYSLTSLSTITLSAGGQINYSNHVNVTPSPAPAGLVLALAGLPVFGLGAYIRRRRAVTA